MQALWKHLSDESARRAWIGVGAPILALVVVIIALAVAAFAGFARKTDDSFALNSQRLAERALTARAEGLASMVVDYANWDESVAYISDAWDEEWTRANMYSSVADAMFVLRADGEVRHAWFGEGAMEGAQRIQTRAIEAAVTIPDLRRLARAATPAETAAYAFAAENGRLMIVALAPVTVEDNDLRRAQPRPGGHDYIAVVDMLDREELDAFANAIDLSELAFTPALRENTARDRVRLLLRAPTGAVIGALQWRHEFPGAAAFQRQIGPVVLGLIVVGLLTILIARKLVGRLIEVMSSAKAAQESSREKSEILARVTTELRTPLNAVIGYAELIQEEARSPGVQKDAQRIIDAARQLSVMLGDIIDQSRIDAGHMRLHLEVLPVAGMLAEIQGLMHPVARAAGVEIVVVHDPLANFVFADHARLRQCLLNMVGNAVKFSPRGGEVRLNARLSREGAGDIVVIEVRDSGIGIEAQEMPAIFRPFGQANDAIGAVYGGAGLGLSIARALARDMGGDISVISTPGEGSSFYLRVPAATARALSAA